MKTVTAKRQTPRGARSRPVKLCEDIIESIKSGVYRADNKGNVSYANQAFAEMLNYPNRDEILGCNLAKDFYQKRKDRADFLKAMREKGYVSDYKIRMVRKDGSVAVVSVHSHFVRDPEGRVVGVQGIVSDVPDTKDRSFAEGGSPAGEESGAGLDEGLRLLAEDPLTGVHNYQHFVRSLDYETRRATHYGRPLCVLMTDMDNFEIYNEAYGHKEGDRLLKEVAGILKQNLRETDILCRHSGDAFIVILPETAKDEALATAAKIKKAVETYSFKRRMTCSIGLARHIAGMTWNELFLKANTGLCMAKEVGKNDVCLYG